MHCKKRGVVICVLQHHATIADNKPFSLACVFYFSLESDPQSPLTLGDFVYDDLFLKSIFNSISKYGILVSQVGVSPSLYDPPEMHSRHKGRAAFVKGAADVGFQSILTYEEVSSAKSM